MPNARSVTRPGYAEQEGEHALSLNKYHKEDTRNVDYQYWVLIEKV
jgi:hypothetical protein